MKNPFFQQVEPGELDSLLERLTSLSQLSGQYLFLLAGSTVIATLGLYLNSPAIVIGAMIIAPLMGPLVGLAFAGLTAEPNLLQKSLVTLVCGTIFGALIACAVGLVFHADPFTPEILSRTRPTLLDLVVACAAGAIGAYCQMNNDLADTIAGVAISVALVPPLGALGIGIAVNIPEIWIGAAWLYFTNLLGITVAGVVVFLFMGYRSAVYSPGNLTLTGLIIAILMIPLSYSFYELFLENDLSRRIPHVLQSKTDKFKDIQLQDVQVRRFMNPMRVVATVYGSENSITPLMVKEVQNLLTREVRTPIDFRVRIVPSSEIRAPGAVRVTAPGTTRFVPSISIKAVEVTPSGKVVKPILLPITPADRL